MNILYLSCHEVLEYNDLQIINNLGHHVISIGGYCNPQQPVNSPRPALDIEQVSLAKTVEHIKICSQLETIDPQIAEWADVIWVTHRADWLSNIAMQVGKKKQIILRTIGQNTRNNENTINQLKTLGYNISVVRYSPMEFNIPQCQHVDRIIRFSCDSRVFSNWNGYKEGGIAIAQLLNRKQFTNTEFLMEASKQLGVQLFGRLNEDVGIAELNHDGFISAMQDHRYFLYTGTIPAPYTLSFIEALMMGIPIIALKNRGYSDNLYEVPSIIENEKNGFLANSISDVKYYSDKLQDFAYAKAISDNARATAMSLFDSQEIQQQWGDHLCSLS